MSKDKKKYDGGLVALWVFICILIASLFTIILAICTFNSQLGLIEKKLPSKKKEPTTSKITTAETTEDGWIILSSTKLLGKLAQKESFLLYVGRPTCPHCQAFEPMLKNARAELEQPELFYYNTDKAKHKKSTLRTIDVNEVPSLLFIKKGEVFDRLDNVNDQNAIKLFLEKYKE